MDTSEIQEVSPDSHHSHSSQSFSTPLGSPEFLNSPPLSISIANNDERDNYEILSFMAIFLVFPSVISHTIPFFISLAIWNVFWLVVSSFLSKGKATVSIIAWMISQIIAISSIYLLLCLALSVIILYKPSLIGGRRLSLQLLALCDQVVTIFALALIAVLGTHIFGLHSPFVTPLGVSSMLGVVFGACSTMILLINETYYISHLFPRLKESLINECIISKLSAATSPSIEMPSSLVRLVHDFFRYYMNFGSSRRNMLKKFRYALGDFNEDIELPSYIIKALVNGFNEGPWLCNEDPQALHHRILSHTFNDINRQEFELQSLQSALNSKLIKQLSSMLEVGEGGKVTSSALLRWIETVRQSHFMLKRACQRKRILFYWLYQAWVVTSTVFVIVAIVVLTFHVNPMVVGLFLSHFVSLIFIVSDWAKRYFEALIFISVTQPFMIGDLCIIDDKKVIIEDVCIPRTTVRRLDDNRVIFYANIELSKLQITNCTRDASMDDMIEFSVRYLTEEQMTTLTSQIESYMSQHRSCWDSWSLSPKDLKEKDKVKMVLRFQHTILVEEVREKRKERLFCQIMKICVEQGMC